MAPLPTLESPVVERWYRRHAGPVRVTHWINVVCFTLLLMSGLQIFNAHPALYVGERSDFDHPTMSILTHQSERGIVGETVILGHSFDTTGALGASSEDGQISPRAFPSWITIPSYQDLATGRRWHFFFAWLLVLNAVVYLVWGIVSRHFGRDLLPSRVELSHIGREVLEHLRLLFPRGEAAKRYNVLQQLAYLLVVFVLFPLMILTGLTMSPGIDSAVPQLLTLFGGCQTARLIHFAAASGLVLFVIVHFVMVLVSGVWNNLRSMVTGWYDLGNPRTTDVRDLLHRRDLLKALAAIGGLAVSVCDRVACDMRFASLGRAILSQFEGLVPGGGPMARLPRLIGRGRALEVLLGADDIPGDLAERYGYVNRALPDAELDAFVEALAMRIASFDNQAIAETKNFVNIASLPPDAEIAPEWDACFASIQRPRGPEDGKRIVGAWLA